MHTPTKQGHVFFSEVAAALQAAAAQAHRDSNKYEFSILVVSDGVL